VLGIAGAPEEAGLRPAIDSYQAIVVCSTHLALL
jgi:hypothetical protein